MTTRRSVLLAGHQPADLHDVGPEPCEPTTASPSLEVGERQPDTVGTTRARLDQRARHGVVTAEPPVLPHPRGEVVPLVHDVDTGRAVARWDVTFAEVVPTPGRHESERGPHGEWRIRVDEQRHTGQVA